jgi:hypothetical protein
MGIGRVGRVLNIAVEKLIQVTVETFKGFNQNAFLYASSGNDSPPLPEDKIILVKQDGAGKYSCIGVLTASQGAKPGEKILFARDPDGMVVSKIAMLNDGSIHTKTTGDKNEAVDGDYTLAGKKNVTSEAAKKNTVKGADVEVNGNTRITGGSLECKGTASPTGSGCWCAMPFCAFTGAPQTGDKAEGT